MADRLVIVESPAKAGTIKKFLGGNTKVVASMGHIRDLPKSKLGVNIENNFEPEYINIRGKGDLIKSLKDDAKKAKKVYLATDPDREGEAIAWHLAHILEIDEKISSAEIKPLGIIYEENGEYYLSPLDRIDDIEAIMKEFVESYLKWKNCFQSVKLL